MTPIKCFRWRDNAIWTEDWAGVRHLVCITASAELREFVVHALVGVHGLPARPWDEEAS